LKKKPTTTSKSNQNETQRNKKKPKQQGKSTMLSIFTKFPMNCLGRSQQGK
jgi:hypothetical protein